MQELPGAAQPRPRVAFTAAGFGAGTRMLAEETPVALTYNRVTHAVMLATPADLLDFAVGFSLSERIVDRAAEIEELELVTVQSGVECRMWIATELMERLDRRRRALAGPTGCGLCGLDSLAQAVRPPPLVRAEAMFGAAEVAAAMQALRGGQALGQRTRAVHAAGLWTRDGAALVREDVGRHNALDKLAGAVARAGVNAAAGIVAMTSRVSIELIQKAAIMGSPVLAAVSAPTALAVRTAEAAGITLVGIARDDGFEVFTRPDRIRGASI